MGKVVTSWFSKSAKQACAKKGAKSTVYEGDCSQPSVMTEFRLYKDGKLVFSKWD